MKNKDATQKRKSMFEKKQELLNQIEKDKKLFNSDLHQMESTVKREGKRAAIIGGTMIGVFGIVYLLTQSNKKENHSSEKKQDLLPATQAENHIKNKEKKGMGGALLTFMGTQAGQVIMGVAKNELKKFIESSFKKK